MLFRSVPPSVPPPSVPPSVPPPSVPPSVPPPSVPPEPFLCVKILCDEGQVFCIDHCVNACDADNGFVLNAMCECVCPDGLIEDNGVCVECPEGKEKCSGYHGDGEDSNPLFGEYCVDPCPGNKVRGIVQPGIDGVAPGITNCLACVCPPNHEVDNNGNCVPCADNEEVCNGTCVEKCPENSHRNQQVCEYCDCDTGFVDLGEGCVPVLWGCNEDGSCSSSTGGSYDDLGICLSACGDTCIPPLIPPSLQSLFCTDGTQYGVIYYFFNMSICDWVPEVFRFRFCDDGQYPTDPPLSPPPSPSIPINCEDDPPQREYAFICGYLVPTLISGGLGCFKFYQIIEWCDNCSNTNPSAPVMKNVKLFFFNSDTGDYDPSPNNDIHPDLPCPPSPEPPPPSVPSSVQPSAPSSVQPSIPSSVQPSASIVPSQSVQPSASIVPSQSVQPSVSPSVQPSASIVPSQSVQPSVSPSVQPSASIVPSQSVQPSASIVPSQSIQPSASIVPSQSVQPSVPPSIPPSVPPSIPPSVPPSIPPSVPPSIPPSVPPSIPPSVPPSIPPSVPPSIPPSVPPSIPPSVPPSIPPSVPPSVSPSVHLTSRITTTIKTTPTPTITTTPTPSISISQSGNTFSNFSIKNISGSGPFYNLTFESEQDIMLNLKIGDLYRSLDVSGENSSLYTYIITSISNTGTSGGAYYVDATIKYVSDTENWGDTSPSEVYVSSEVSYSGTLYIREHYVEFMNLTMTPTILVSMSTIMTPSTKITPTTTYTMNIYSTITPRFTTSTTTPIP